MIPTVWPKEMKKAIFDRLFCVRIFGFSSSTYAD